MPGWYPRPKDLSLSNPKPRVSGILAGLVTKVFPETGKVRVEFRDTDEYVDAKLMSDISSYDFGNMNIPEAYIANMDGNTEWLDSSDLISEGDFVNWALVAFIKDNPYDAVVLGFFFPETSALFFNTNSLVRGNTSIVGGFRVERHTSGWYWLADKLGHFEWVHPALKLKVGPDENFFDPNAASRDPERPFPSDADVQDQYGSATDKVVYIDHELFTFKANKTEVRLTIKDAKKLILESSGDIEVGNPGSLSAVGRIGDKVTVELSAQQVANLGLTAGGDNVTAPSPTNKVAVEGTITEGSAKVKVGN